MQYCGKYAWVWCCLSASIHYGEVIMSSQIDVVSNKLPHHCLFNRLFGCKSKKTSKLRVTGLCAGNSPGTGEFPAQLASQLREKYSHLMTSSCIAAAQYVTRNQFCPEHQRNCIMGRYIKAPCFTCCIRKLLIGKPKFCAVENLEFSAKTKR